MSTGLRSSRGREFRKQSTVVPVIDGCVLTALLLWL